MKLFVGKLDRTRLNRVTQPQTFTPSLFCKQQVLNSKRSKSYGLTLSVKPRSSKKCMGREGYFSFIMQVTVGHLKISESIFRFWFRFWLDFSF